MGTMTASRAGGACRPGTARVLAAQEPALGSGPRHFVHSLLALECFEGYVNGAQLVFEVVREDTR